MKNLNTFFLFLLLFALTVSCEDDLMQANERNQPLQRITKTSLSQENQLVHVLDFSGFNNVASNGIKNGRVNSAGFEIETDTILKVLQDDDIHHVYTFKVLNAGIDNSFSNLVIQEIENGYMGYILQYVPIKGKMDILRFTGTLKRFNLEGTLLDEKVFVNGDLSSSGTDNGRAASDDCYQMSITEECTSWDYIYNYQNTQTTGFGCVAYDIVIQFTVVDCGASGGGSAGGGSYIPPSSPDAPSDTGDTNTGGGGGSSSNPSGGSTGDVTIGILTPEECPSGDECDDCQLPMDYNNDCQVDDDESAFFLISEEIPNAKFERYKELMALLKTNPWALIEDCAQQNGMITEDYMNLYNHTIPQACKDRLSNLGIGYSNQPISQGNVPCANIDYYGVEVTTKPDFNNDGQPDTNAQIYQAFRNNFTTLASGQKDNFQFSCTTPLGDPMSGDISWEFVPYSTNDATLFKSSSPIPAILNIEADADVPGVLGEGLIADEGAIMVSGFTPNNWTVSTIATPYNGTQPFSGNRQWGWLINQNGNVEIFTRAVDVAKINSLAKFLTLANEECQQDTYYNVAEATWQNLQQEIADWINNNGGQATINAPKAVRVDKDKIIEILTTKGSIDQILSNCN